MPKLEKFCFSIRALASSLFLSINSSFFLSIMLVFLGTLVANSFHMVYQMIAAHKLPAEDFAAVNSLLAVLSLIAIPAGTLQTAVVAQTAAARARGLGVPHIRAVFREYMRLSFIAGAVTFVFFFLAGAQLQSLLQLASPAPVRFLAIMVCLSWISPVALGMLQGLEMFGWFCSANCATGLVKVASVVFLISLGAGVPGVLLSVCLSLLTTILVAQAALFSFKNKRPSVELRKEASSSLRQIFSSYLLPVSFSLFLFTFLVTIDMIFVKSFFPPAEAGIYSFAQMAGKIFLFLPSAVPLVMLPKTSGMAAVKADSGIILGKSIIMTVLISVAGAGLFNLFPGFFLRLLTGASSPSVILLGRFFSLSMSLFAVVYVFIIYFIALRDFRFIKFLILSAVAQAAAFVIFHSSLISIQQIMCLNAFVLVFLLIGLFKRTSDRSRDSEPGFYRKDV
ncbi:MAG: oligosaccharide flippase family protein [Candidatus Omnitrophota bacterium]